MPALPRTLLFGSGSGYSRLALEALLRARIPVAGIILPRPAGQPPDDPPIRTIDGAVEQRSLLPLLEAETSPGFLEMSRDHCIPALEVGRLQEDATLAALASMRPDLIVTACFPRILPRSLIALAPLGGLNVHPSLLPAHSGPVPLFWTFRGGNPESGVTIHWLDEGIDTGPVALQERITLREGVSGDELQGMLAQVGARLLADAVLRLARGDLPREPQNPDEGIDQSWPQAKDWVVDDAWSAARAFRFFRGVVCWGRPVLRVANEELRVSAAESYDAESWLDVPMRRDGTDLLVRLSPGVIRVRAQG